MLKSIMSISHRCSCVTWRKRLAQTVRPATTCNWWMSRGSTICSGITGPSPRPTSRCRSDENEYKVSDDARFPGGGLIGAVAGTNNHDAALRSGRDLSDRQPGLSGAEPFLLRGESRLGLAQNHHALQRVGVRAKGNPLSG